MIEEYGVVERIHGSKMDIRIDVPGSCDACAIRESCYGRGHVITVPRDDSVMESDRVHLEIEKASVLGLSAIVYGLPLVALFAGVLAGYYGFFAHAGEGARVLGSFVLSIALVVASAVAVRHLSRRLTQRVEYHTSRA